MSSIRQTAVQFVTDLAWRLGIRRIAGTFGPLLIDRGWGMLYDVERNITWLQDANYAKTIGRTADGQLTWNDAMGWVATLNYRGIHGWRLPNALNSDGSGPCEGENCRDGEIGHLFFVAALRKSPPDLELLNFEPFSIYWYATEASATEAYAFKMTGVKQGRLAKNPWMLGDLPVPLPDKVLAWPVHDGDVGAGIFSRFIRSLLQVVRKLTVDEPVVLTLEDVGQRRVLLHASTANVYREATIDAG